MIRTLCLLGVLMTASAPALAQQPLPPEIQEMVDKIHLDATAERMVPIEQVPLVFERTAAGDYAHKPSGFVCPHTEATLFGMMPAFVVLFDDPNVGDDIGCGMVQRGVNLNIFVFRRDSDMASVVQDEASASRHDVPPDTSAKQPRLATAEALGIPPGGAFGGEAWTAQSGQEQAIYVTRVGTWFVEANVSTDPEMTELALGQVRRMFMTAHAQIKS